MDNEKVIYYLELWQDYMKQNNNKLGYKSKSTGFISGGIHSFEDMADENDHTSAKTVDKCIDALPPLEKTAVYCRWLGEKTLINPIMIDTFYGVALEKLGKKLTENNLY